jgi:hypothetical protein
MRIVQQPASLSYSPILALPAPKIAGLLPPPRIAGLLPARVATPNVEIIPPAPRSIEELFAQLGPIRSREAMNAELVALVKPHPPSATASRCPPLRREGESRVAVAPLPMQWRGAGGELLP